MPLRPSELEAHCAQELESLAKLSAAVLVSSRTHQQQQAQAHAQHAAAAFRPPGFDPASPYGGKQISPRAGGMIEVAPRSRWDVSY